jgi:hypothetical protein
VQAVRVELHPAFSLELNEVCHAYQGSVIPVKKCCAKSARVCGLAAWSPSWF